MPVAFIIEKTKEQVTLRYSFNTKIRHADVFDDVRVGEEFYGWTFEDLQKASGKIEIPKAEIEA